MEYQVTLNCDALYELDVNRCTELNSRAETIANHYKIVVAYWGLGSNIFQNNKKGNYIIGCPRPLLPTDIALMHLPHLYFQPMIAFPLMGKRTLVGSMMGPSNMLTLAENEQLLHYSLIYVWLWRIMVKGNPPSGQNCEQYTHSYNIWRKRWLQKWPYTDSQAMVNTWLVRGLKE